MNNLSWLIYAANIAGNLQTALILFLILGGFACTMATVIALAEGGYEGLYAKRCSDGWKAIAAASILAVFTPTQNTIYAIAASEMAETALSTPTATKAMKALDAWLDRQIAPEKEQNND